MRSPFSRTSLSFGSIGSGKTAAVVYPVLESITSIYNNDDPTMPDAKWGGFVLDVKGDFHEAVIYMMEKHGRDLLSDLVVIRPDNDYYVLEFEEVTTKEHFLVSCTGGTSMQECDAVLAKAEGPESVLGTDLSHNKVLRLPNGDTEPLSSFVFSDRGAFRRKEIHELLEQLEFDVRGLSVRWLGWREDKGGRLVRVTNTHKRQVQYGRGQNGNVRDHQQASAAALPGGSLHQQRAHLQPDLEERGLDRGGRPHYGRGRGDRQRLWQRQRLLVECV